MTLARSRYSSSGIATRRVVPSACLAWAVVNGCGSRARILAACACTEHAGLNAAIALHALVEKVELVLRRALEVVARRKPGT